VDVQCHGWPAVSDLSRFGSAQPGTGLRTQHCLHLHRNIPSALARSAPVLTVFDDTGWSSADEAERIVGKQPKKWFAILRMNDDLILQFMDSLRLGPE
jgi:hypothetical protein